MWFESHHIRLKVSPGLKKKIYTLPKNVIEQAVCCEFCNSSSRARYSLTVVTQLAGVHQHTDLDLRKQRVPDTSLVPRGSTSDQATPSDDISVCTPGSPVETFNMESDVQLHVLGGSGRVKRLSLGFGFVLGYNVLQCLSNNWYLLFR